MEKIKSIMVGWIQNGQPRAVSATCDLTRIEEIKAICKESVHFSRAYIIECGPEDREITKKMVMADYLQVRG